MPIKLSSNGVEVGKSNIICYSKANVTESNISCTSDSDCVAEFTNVYNEAKNSGQAGEQIPEFAFDYIKAGIFCDNVCKIKQIRGLSGENIESCNADEETETITLTPYKLVKILQQTKQG